MLLLAESVWVQMSLERRRENPAKGVRVRAGRVWFVVSTLHRQSRCDGRQQRVGRGWWPLGRYSSGIKERLGR